MINEDYLADVPPLPVDMDPANPIPGVQTMSVDQRRKMDVRATAQPDGSPSIPERMIQQPVATPTPKPIQPARFEAQIHPDAKFADPELLKTIEGDPKSVVLDGHKVSKDSFGAAIEQAIRTEQDLKRPVAAEVVPEPMKMAPPVIAEDAQYEEVPAELPADIDDSVVEEPAVSTSDTIIAEDVTVDTEPSADISEVEFSDAESESFIPNRMLAPTEDEVPSVPDVVEGPYVQGITVESAEKRSEVDETFISGPKKLDPTQLIEIQDHSTTHYRIIDGINKELAKLNAPIQPSKDVKIINFKDRSDFDMQKTRIDQATADGERRVQVVAIQSGYVAMVRPMKSREIRTFGRELRDTDTYSYKMSIYQAIYSKMCDFSCGPLTFEQFINLTAYPDIQTLIFGLYMSTFPTVNNFNLTCYKCGQTFSVPIGNNTLVCIPPGSVAQQKITEVLNRRADPKSLITESARNKGIDIYINKGIKFFRVKTPSIAEFLENAYRGKKEEVIEANLSDMYYAGYIRGIGKLDIEKYNKTGEQEYYFDHRIESIDREIAMLDPDEKEAFDKAMLNYINQYSVSYQIPRVRCPHCEKIMNQRELNMETLFFAVRSQKGLV